MRRLGSGNMCMAQSYEMNQPTSKSLRHTSLCVCLCISVCISVDCWFALIVKGISKSRRVYISSILLPCSDGCLGKYNSNFIRVCGVFLGMSVYML